MPFYQYNSFTGRIKPSANFQPLYPLRTEPPVMIYDTIKTKPLTVIPKSGYSTDKPASLNPKMLQKFKFFQTSIDKPVYLAGGKKDKILFGFTVAYVGICTLQSLVFVAKECLNII
ncbi:uncharacterized protein LOC105248832 isoform X2 [Camponotus floridanus]|uniref:uncharacterized protein LOC105248832 isoform X2 n=1 Tax=Camponotus floridanus TaxID=104421 RepID=UPI00059CE1EF|nr:uncharacterized protein LOC105248832 isoform X2 [Camponotus floridanus]